MCGTPPHGDISKPEEASAAHAVLERELERLKNIPETGFDGQLPNVVPVHCSRGTELEPLPHRRHPLSDTPENVYAIIPGKFSFAVHPDEEYTSKAILEYPRIFFFSSCLHEAYEPFCADFGPVNLGIVFRFIQFMRSKFQHPKLRNRHMVYYVDDDAHFKANAAFLLGCYLVLDLGWSPEEAAAEFQVLDNLPFRDATFCKSDFDLTLLDCLTGLQRATKEGFFDPMNFDLETYEFWDDPEMADMHQICPKFWAFRGPVDSNQNLPSSLDFAEVFKRLDVTAVVQLNEEDEYESISFFSSGIKHYKLDFPDCTVPPLSRVREFLALCKEEKAVAIHCKAGLGRTGTMIAIYLMEHHGWTARECIGWLRIARPGSVIGPQQQFLVAWEKIGLENADIIYSKSFISDDHATVLAQQVTRSLGTRSLSYGSGLAEAAA